MGSVRQMEFVNIPGGVFQMGSKEDKSEQPVHTVTIQPFKIQTTEVTVGQFSKFVAATGYKTDAENGEGSDVWVGNGWDTETDANWQKPYYNQGESHPVVCVSWNDAQTFIRWLNETDPGRGYRLPTEAEWEYACRAGTTTLYSTGDDEAALNKVAWFDVFETGTAHPVAEKLPNAYGLYDMHGNVWEWCSDWFHESYEGAPVDGSSWDTPAGTDHVARGGSVIVFSSICRSSFRSRYAPEHRFNQLGFRLVCK